MNGENIWVLWCGLTRRLERLPMIQLLSPKELYLKPSELGTSLSVVYSSFSLGHCKWDLWVFVRMGRKKETEIFRSGSRKKQAWLIFKRWPHYSTCHVGKTALFIIEHTDMSLLSALLVWLWKRFGIHGIPLKGGNYIHETFHPFLPLSYFPSWQLCLGWWIDCKCAVSPICFCLLLCILAEKRNVFGRNLLTSLINILFCVRYNKKINH